MLINRLVHGFVYLYFSLCMLFSVGEMFCVTVRCVVRQFNQVPAYQYYNCFNRREDSVKSSHAAAAGDIGVRCPVSAARARVG